MRHRIVKDRYTFFANQILIFLLACFLLSVGSCTVVQVMEMAEKLS